MWVPHSPPPPPPTSAQLRLLLLDEVKFDIHEPEYTDGSNEVLKIFNQKRVVCLERDSEYIFKQCSH